MPDLASADWIGSTGVALLLLAFALNLTGHLRHESLTYPAMNLVGAGLAAYASWLIDYMPFVVLEGTWVVVSAYALSIRLTFFSSKIQMDALRRSREDH